MTRAPAVSVVIPLFDSRDTVARSISSILRQTFEEFEVVVVDDGSSDDGAEVVAAITDPRVQVIHQRNQGPAAARNRGVRAGQADVIAFLDADDEWAPTYLETIWELTRAYPHAGVVATNCEVREAGCTWIPSSRFMPPAGQTGNLERFFRICAKVMPFGPSCSAVRRAVLERADGFPESMRCYEDLATWARIAVAHPLIYRNQPLCVYYNRTALRDPRPSVENRRRLIRRLKQVRADASRVQRADIDYLIASLRVGEAAAFVAHGETHTARRLLLESPGSFGARPGLWTAVLALSLMPRPAVQLARAVRRARAGRPFDGG